MRWWEKRDRFGCGRSDVLAQAAARGVRFATRAREQVRLEQIAQCMRAEHVTGQLVLHQTLAAQHEQRFGVLRVKRRERQQRLQEHARDA